METPNNETVPPQPSGDWRNLMKDYYSKPVATQEEPIQSDPTDINGFSFQADIFYDNLMRTQGIDELVKYNSSLTNGICNFWFL